MKKVVNENQKSTLRKVLRYIRRYWGYLGASIILAAVTVALTLYLPILIGQAVDRIVGKGAVDFAGIFVILKDGGHHRTDGSGTVGDECLQQ